MNFPNKNWCTYLLSESWELDQLLLGWPPPADVRLSPLVWYNPLELFWSKLFFIYWWYNAIFLMSRMTVALRRKASGTSSLVILPCSMRCLSKAIAATSLTFLSCILKSISKPSSVTHSSDAIGSRCVLLRIWNERLNERLSVCSLLGNESWALNGLDELLDLLLSSCSPESIDSCCCCWWEPFESCWSFWLKKKIIYSNYIN